MDSIRSKLFNKLEKLVLKISNKRSKWKQWYIQQKDDALGREMIGRDKFGNKYYQYFSFHGLPTKRIVLYKFFDTNKFHNDPHFIEWIYKRQLIPPTPEELERLYLEHDAFQERALQWDQEQLKMIEEYKSKRNEMDLDSESDAKMLDEGKKLDAQKWIPNKNRVKGNKGTELVKVSQIDEMENAFFEEYEKVMAKDESKSKDFNKVVYEEGKKARYFFEYLRTQENLYMYEKQKLQELNKQDEEEKVQQEKRDQMKAYQSNNKLQKVINQESVKKFEEKVETKNQELKSNRYDQFREQFEDIFEQILDKNKLNNEDNMKM